MTRPMILQLRRSQPRQRSSPMKRFALVAVVMLAVVSLGTSTLSAQKNKLIANAVVKSVSATSLVVTAGGKDPALTVDAKSRVVGKGIGTKSGEMKGKAAITDLIKAGDKVSVTYADAGTTMRAVT